MLGASPPAHVKGADWVGSGKRFLSNRDPLVGGPAGGFLPEIRVGG